jgi:hypothetical protein
MRRIGQVLAPMIVLAWAAPAAMADAPRVEIAVPGPPPPAAPALVPRDHPVVRSGWVRTFRDREFLLTEPRDRAPDAAIGPSRRVAGRVQRVVRDGAGGTWVRVAFPGKRRGWVRLRALRSVPAPQQFTPALRRALSAAAARRGGHAAVVVRDRWGRTLFSTGSRRPLVLASLTKLFTVGAALDAMPDRRLAGQILAPSDNAKAQRLVEWFGGGSNAAGTRAAESFAASLGAEVRLYDGSGLDARNRASAGETVDFLHEMRGHGYFRAFRRGLAVLGRSGTLRDRLAGPRTRGRAQAKTGTLFVPSVATLAGYLQPRRTPAGPNRELTFAMLHNGISYRRARHLQDRMLALLILRR